MNLGAESYFMLKLKKKKKRKGKKKSFKASTMLIKIKIRHLRMTFLCCQISLRHLPILDNRTV